MISLAFMAARLKALAARLEAVQVPPWKSALEEQVARETRGVLPRTSVTFSPAADRSLHPR